MFVGGFWPWHGLDLLVESFREVVRKAPNAQLVLVGDGPTKLELEARVAEYGIQENVTFTGSVEHTKIPALLNRADICVAPYPRFTSEFWMSPMKLYEYMAAGKAIIASDAGMISEVIRDHVTGRLVQPGDTSELTRTLIELLHSPALRSQLGENARQQARKEHSWDRYVEKLEDVYQSVLF
jgi:glycosyltransferase involved in cell wall biosynthesis